MNDFLDAGRIGQLDVVELSNTPFGNVCVAVNQSRCRHTTMQVDDLCRGTRQTQDVAIRADRDNYAGTNGDRLRD